MRTFFFAILLPRRSRLYGIAALDQREGRPAASMRRRDRLLAGL
ncbi:MAG: hypothetical protein U0575_15475 [Phycisphaerales bacterium]